MTLHTADRLIPFGTTIFAEMTRLAQEHEAVNLSQGFPDFDGPEFIKRAAQHAMAAGRNQYARSAGVPELVTQIASRFAARTGVAVDPLAQVTVTSGCTEAIVATLMGLLNPGDEIVLFEPYYDSYRAAVAMAGAVPRFVAMRENNGRFAFDPAELRAAFTPRTEAVLVNTPHNPTGAVLTREELGEIARLCAEHDAIAISDEVYEELTYDVEHVSIASLPGMAERTVTLSSLGKTFSLTGWKVGWAIASAELSAAVRAAHQFITFSVPTPLQYGAATALRDGDAYIGELRAQYRSARDFLADHLSVLGFGVVAPKGTYFIMADHTAISDRLGVDDDIELCRKLTAEFGVAAIPPSVFYEHAELGRRYVRFAFCKKMETLEEAVRRLDRLRA